MIRRLWNWWRAGAPERARQRAETMRDRHEPIIRTGYTPGAW